VKEENKVHLVNKEHLAYKDQQVVEDLQALQALQEKLVNQDLLESKEVKVSKEDKGKEDHQDLQEKLAQLVKLDPEDQQVLLGKEAPVVLLVMLVHQERMDSKGLQDNLDLKAKEDQLDQLVQLVNKEVQDL